MDRARWRAAPGRLRRAALARLLFRAGHAPLPGRYRPSLRRRARGLAPRGAVRGLGRSGRGAGATAERVIATPDRQRPTELRRARARSGRARPRFSARWAGASSAPSSAGCSLASGSALLSATRPSSARDSRERAASSTTGWSNTRLRRSRHLYLTVHDGERVIASRAVRDARRLGHRDLPAVPRARRHWWSGAAPSTGCASAATSRRPPRVDRRPARPLRDAPACPRREGTPIDLLATANGRDRLRDRAARPADRARRPLRQLPLVRLAARG